MLLNKIRPVSNVRITAVSVSILIYANHKKPCFMECISFAFEEEEFNVLLGIFIISDINYSKKFYTLELISVLMHIYSRYIAQE